MPYAVPLENATIQQIITLYQQQVSCREISARLGLGDFEGRRVKRVLRNASVYAKWKQPLRRKSKCSLNDRFFENITTEEQAYWLGFIAADGCVIIDTRGRYYLSVHLHRKDLSHLQKLQQALGSNHKLEVREDKCQLRVASRPLCRDLMRLGIIPRKSKTLQFPRIDPVLDVHLIRGFFDGDGCAYQRGRNFLFQFLGTQDVITNIRARVSPGGSLQRIERCENLYALNYAGFQQPHEVGQYLYRSATVYLARKKARFDAFVAEYPLDSASAKSRNLARRWGVPVPERALQKSLQVPGKVPETPA